jgi:hypothetical protein
VKQKTLENVSECFIDLSQSVSHRATGNHARNFEEACAGVPASRGKIFVGKASSE